MLRSNLKFLLAAVFIMLTVLFYLFASAGEGFSYYWQDKLFSPGELYFRHLTYQDKKITCQDCHLPGRAITNDICAKCHTLKRLQQNSPQIADSHRLFKQKDYCLRCHGEHRGSYTSIKKLGFTPEDHRQLPFKSNKCVVCHALKSKTAHLSLTNSQCQDCHKNYSWATDFNHRRFLSRAQSPRAMLELCRQCHQPGHHYNTPNTLHTQGGCIFCHEYWAKRRERKSIPFPEQLFSQVPIDPKTFTFK